MAIEEFIQDSLKITKEKSEGIVDWSSYIGEGPSAYDLGYNADEPNSNYAHILVNTSHFLANGSIVKKLDTYCFNAYYSIDKLR